LAFRFLFYKRELKWPFESGHDVHTFNLIRALQAGGDEVALATTIPLPGSIGDRLPLSLRATLTDAPGESDIRLSGLQERFRSYWGVPGVHVRQLGDLARTFRADVVAVSGLEVLPYLGAVTGAVRVWYAADEWVLHHLSQVQLLNPSTWGNVRDAAIKGMYERAFGPLLDRVWVVSKPDRRAMQFVAGVHHLDILPNGIDADTYAPEPVPERENSAVFWGRLDFGPNIQALEWFCVHVWPRVRAARPGATFTIIGFHPTRPVTVLAQQPGIEIIGNVPDIRPEVMSRAVVVLPFVSGGGVKNKLLEAAAMGKAIVCSSRALGGVLGEAPFRAAQTPDEWVQALTHFWERDDARRDAGVRAREWVLREHSWMATADVARSGIAESIRRMQATAHRPGRGL
jgi:glycosyltransferase involved in cell wall biosynthesis